MVQAVLSGSYELLERIAEGGMAEVWRARSRGVAGFEKTVVIKRVLPALMRNPNSAKMLVREAKIAALLNHPNIVQIFDLGEEQGNYFIAMEYVHGRDLGMAVSLRGTRPDAPRLSLALKLWIVAETAKALDYAHRRRGTDGKNLNIIHRDVSPQNVLLSYEGAVKVADFGIARADEQDLGRGEDPKVLRGKYAYMSPEQAQGEVLDRRSDLFSLGVVLYELLADRRLFRSGSTEETLAKVRAAEVPPLDLKRLGAPPALQDVLEQTLALDRDARYASAAEIRDDLNQILFKLGEQVGEPDLAQLMERMFPQEERDTPNKLSIDVMMRAYEDATAVSESGLRDKTPARYGRQVTEETHAFPASRRIKAERTRVAILAVAEDPEHEAAFTGAVEGVGGLVLKPLGGIREALFGQSSGGERAAEHAVRAAFDFRQRLVREVPARHDRLPGMAVIRGIATSYGPEAIEPTETTRGEVTALLETVPPASVVVNAALRAELARTFHLSEQEPVTVEGFRSRGDPYYLAARQVPLVGRRSEIRVLTENLVAAAEGGDTTAMLIAGEPGIGKSRLVSELRALIAPLDVVVVRGRGDRADAERSFGALGDVFADLCGLEAEDGPRERFRKVERLKILGLNPSEVRTVGELLGLMYPFAKEERPGRPRGLELVMAARRALRALAVEKTVLLVLEDLHWMDDATRQLLPLLVRGLSRSRVVTVMTCRLTAGMVDDEVEMVALRPLDRSSAGKMFALSLGARHLEDDVAEFVWAQTGGIPAWVNALAEAAAAERVTAVEDGVLKLSSTSLPVTEGMRALGATRLAELRPLDRELLRAVAAYRNDVAPRELFDVVGVSAERGQGALRRLFGLRLLAPGRDVMIPVGSLQSIFPGSGEWGGGHLDVAIPERITIPAALLRRTVMALMSDLERRRLHGAITAVLERVAGDARIGALSYHAARSVDARRATDYLLRAAELALEEGRPDAAAEKFSEAAELTRKQGGSSERTFQLFLRAAQAQLDAGDPTAAERLVETADAGGEPSPELQLERDLVRARVFQGLEQWSDADRLLGELSARVAGRGGLVGEVSLIAGEVKLRLGDSTAACERLTEAVEELQGTSGDACGRALCDLAVALARCRRLSEASSVVADALAWSARRGGGPIRHASLASMAEVQHAEGNFAAAARRFREAAEVARNDHALDMVARYNIGAALAHLDAGEETDAIVLAEEGVRAARGRGLRVVATLGGCVQGALAVEAHPDPEYLGRLVRSADELEERGYLREAALAVAMVARANVALSDVGAAVRSLQRAAELAKSAGDLALQLRFETRATELSTPA
ncbi:MAG: protein kinase [Myxococcota bacterium]